MRVLMITPEPPYPLHGGGAYRIASLVHYFSRLAHVDLILISESGQPALLPDGLVQSQTVIPLPVHGKGMWERYTRNARRAVRGVPPLIDRLSGLAPAIANAVRGRRYDLGIIEHFWCAPYIGELQAVCDETVLDLHNVESVLHKRCAATGSGLIAAGHRRFAPASRKLESTLLPRFSRVLVTSESDARLVTKIAPAARTVFYPNALPRMERSLPSEQPALVFSANFEYHPNIDAVRYLTSEIWPETRKYWPELKIRLVGRGDSSIRHLLPLDAGIETTGPVADARAEIAAAQVVIAPLRAGSGTRIKILEAWSAARPVVATSIAAEGLLAEHGGNIVLADTAADFARAIVDLLGDPEKRRRLGTAGQRTFETHYTWEAAWRELDRNLQLAGSVELNRYTG
jgi:glycosyltransferase involved in cell wall biosynthesis